MKVLKTIIFMLILTVMVFAQTNQRQIPSQHFNNWKNILNLTTEQQIKIDALHDTQRKKSMAMMNQIKVLRAEIIVLGANNGSRKDVLAKENLIIEKRAEVSKLHLIQHEAVRALLTEEQKQLFDENFPHLGMGRGEGHGNRMGKMSSQSRRMNGFNHRSGQGHW